jgi:hypothetical protein
LHDVQLRWVYGSEVEPIAKPNLATPRGDGVSSPTLQWTLTIPPGYRLANDQRDFKVENLRMAADKGVESSGAPGRTKLVRWQTNTQDGPPSLALVSVESDNQRRLWIATICVVMVVLIVLFAPLLAWPSRRPGVS